MAGQSWRTLGLLILFSLLSLTEQFEVRDGDWEELRPDIAALHHLRGLSEHMFHERLKDPLNQRYTSTHGARVERSSSRVDTDKDPMSLQDDLQACDSFSECDIQKKKDFESFSAAIDEQKIEDKLLIASEISHSYRHKLLVMTDNEKSTNDRVQQEYSIDPHYSVIVRKECLYNVSCVPETDSYTVVKIFGSVSGDGQTVSGLSGSSLAELMLKPPLKAVPVFSIDGNTTTDFQHNFIRVFMVRGIKIVLETNQENHQIYQVMNQPDSVSQYQIPHRPVDHTTQYDHQQILIMEDDPIVKKAATSLYMKRPAVSSVYVLDKNQKLKLIHGSSVPLSEDSRLELVSHGKRDDSGEMRLAGYTARDVAKIIAQTFRVGDKIKTISIVACEVGSDKVFVETLLRELHETAGIETELHVRNAVVQVTHTGEKITQEISKEGLQWRHKDDSKKVVATLDKNGDVIIRNGTGSKGEAVFTNERNLLNGKNKNKPVANAGDSWPDTPQRFIDQDVFGTFKGDYQNKIPQIRKACDELEALSWGFFHAELEAPGRININNLQQIVIGELTANKEKLEWIKTEEELKKVVSKRTLHEIRSGEDVRKVIRQYAKNKVNEPIYLMVSDWIYYVEPEKLYVYPVGKRLDDSQRGNQEEINEVKKCIGAQIGKGKDSYTSMQNNIPKEIYFQQKSYGGYVIDIFLGEHNTRLPLLTQAQCGTYFTASVISESIRNFRTFPLVLMALDMLEREDQNIRQKGHNFLVKEHSMAKGSSWIDPNKRGFYGSVLMNYKIADDAAAAAAGGSAAAAAAPAAPAASATTDDSAKDKFTMLIEKEFQQYQSWIDIDPDAEDIQAQILAMVQRYRLASNADEENKILNDYKTFKDELNRQP